MAIPFAKNGNTDFMFTKLQVKDLDKAVSFYSSAIGLVEMNRVEAEINGRKVSEVVFMPTYEGGPLFILAQFHDTQTPVANESILGLATKDIADLIARVEKAGGRVLEPAREVPGMGGMQVSLRPKAVSIVLAAEMGPALGRLSSETCFLTMMVWKATCPNSGHGRYD